MNTIMLSGKSYRCRLCLKVSKEVINIFREDFSKMIKLLTTIEVKPNDDLPKVACINCTKKVKEAMLIRRQIIRSHKTLMEEERVKKNKSSTSNLSSNNSNSNLSKTNDGKENNATEFIFIEVNDLNKKEEDDVIFVGSSKIEPVAVKKEHAKIQDLQDSLGKNGISIIKVNKKKLTTSIKCAPGVTKNIRAQIISKKFKTKPILNTKSQVPSQRIAKLNLKPVTNVQARRNLPKPRIRKSTYDPLARLPCKICQKTIQTTNMKKHVETHDQKVATCHICGKVVKNTSLRSHIFYFHKCKENEYICDQCGRHFRYRTKFNLHMKKEHGGTRDFECTICGRRFFERKFLRKHVDSHHKKIRPYICDSCGKNFSTRHALKVHFRQHTESAPYSCDRCEQSFKQNVSLKTHRRQAHAIFEDESVICEECGKGFASKVALASHFRLHERKKCPHCTEFFIKDEYMERHIKEQHIENKSDEQQHEVEEPYDDPGSMLKEVHIDEEKPEDGMLFDSDEYMLKDESLNEEILGTF